MHQLPSALPCAITAQPHPPNSAAPTPTSFSNSPTPASHLEPTPTFLQCLLTCPTKTPTPVAMVMNDDTKALQVGSKQHGVPMVGCRVERTLLPERCQETYAQPAQAAGAANTPFHSFSQQPRSLPLRDREHV